MAAKKRRKKRRNSRTAKPIHKRKRKLLKKKKRPHRKPKSKRQRTVSEQRPRTIGYVIPSCDISGGVAVICQHVNRLQARGLNMVLISMDQTLNHIDWFPQQKVPIITLEAASQLHFDTVVATHWSTAHPTLQLSADRKVYFVQSIESRFYPEGSAEYEAAKQTYRLPFIYMTEARWIQNWLLHNNGHTSIYVPNGIDETLFHPTEHIEPKRDKVRVLLEGPILNPLKGMAEAFRVVRDLDCEIWCVSSNGEPDPEYRCDRFFSHVPMEHMKHIYSSCDILLKLSHVEGFFGPPMEMMACGGTAVVGNCTGHEEYIIDGYNALVVPLGDEEAAKAGLNQLIHDPQLRLQLTQNGKATVQNWRWDATIDTLFRLFS
ncbi:glycosyltransferase family 4 protein [Paenibacillus lignilyticus]|uniref:Glycosyltransferase family 4 protein n=1 Tax=Paenibacillus lignilyticus TaxID=1172615 RepID=A0ABS5CB52_9BACL|nr:glycosyltransferase family 4 protein [Paenibacillus lignilyticus]